MIYPWRHETAGAVRRSRCLDLHNQQEGKQERGAPRVADHVFHGGNDDRSHLYCEGICKLNRSVAGANNLLRYPERLF
jgi:hypothetical protein